MAFRFLDLAAELRNRIYAFAAIGNGELMRLKIGKTRDNTYAGLSMVNKQIRKEYRPVRRREAKIEVAWEEVEAFIDTFLSTDEDKASPSQILRVLTKGHNKYDANENVIDIMPLLHIKLLAPLFQCEFDKTSPPPKDDLSWDSLRQKSVYYSNGMKIELEIINELVNH